MPDERRNLFGRALVTGAADTPPANGGLTLDIGAELKATIGTVAQEVQALRSQSQQLWAGVRPIPGIPVPQITTAAGKADYPELLSPRTGYWWDVRLVACATFSSGSVNLYRNNADDYDIVGAFTSAGWITYASGQLLLNWNQRLIFAAQTITGNATPSIASVIEVRADVLPAYLL